MKSFFLSLFIYFNFNLMTAQTTVLQTLDLKNQLTWRIINDGVMGGISRSKMELLPTGKWQFSGTVSLENNGGFASTRGILVDHPMQSFSKIKVRLKGDGNKYSFRIRTDDNFDGVAYKNDFATKGGEWEEIILSLIDFIPTWRGRQLQNVSAITPTKISQIGFLISDKQKGAFSLLVDSIQFLE